ncbi:hypothetical protein BRC19_02350 [Candidatus Saccharibacteria bacterium QS_5_54_17]|nr:MAG: hypothetical protein BRC19_02350 [Candidatus Saccharibacteria bacterium QS_5_54_17]
MMRRNLMIACGSLWRNKWPTLLSVLAVTLTVVTVVFALVPHVPPQTTITPLSDLVRGVPTSTALLAGATLLMGGLLAMSLGIASVIQRREEIIIRRIHGAKRRHIFGQIVLEMAMVIAAGGLLGVAIVAAVAAMWDVPGSGLLDPLYLTFTLLLVIIAGMAVGIPPALAAIKYRSGD